MVAILLVLGLAVFGLMKLAPSDMVENYVRAQMLVSADRQADNVYTEEQIAAARARLGLDLPFYAQYARWLYQVVVERDLGRSLISRAPILFLIQSRMVNSLVLNLISLVFLTLLSFATGLYFSSKVGTRVDLAATFTALLLHAFPGILLLILLQLFAAVSGWFPITAYPDFPFREAPLPFAFSYLHHIALPLFAAFLGGVGGTMRYIRATMLDQLGQPWVTALRSRRHQRAADLRGARLPQHPQSLHHQQRRPVRRIVFRLADPGDHLLLSRHRTADVRGGAPGGHQPGAGQHHVHQFSDPAGHDRGRRAAGAGRPAHPLLRQR